MRGSDLSPPTLLSAAALGVLALGLVSTLACKEGGPAASTAIDSSSDPARGEGSNPSSKADPAPRPDPTPKADPLRGDELRDLDVLCAALDHDYKDGTLRDYYAKVEMKTDWGRTQREAGDASVQPGRLLEKAVADLDPTGDAPELEHCRLFLDYIDDVE